MKDIGRHMEAILQRIGKKGAVLMLDFDGVLAPIVQTPSNARMSRSTRSVLERCAEKMPVAIITGRTLSDINKRVGLKKNVIYAGSHGLEWSMLGRVRRRAISRGALVAYAAMRDALLKYAKEFPALFIEDKTYGLALGYRSLSKEQASNFRRGAMKIVRPALRAERVRVVDNLYTFEIMCEAEWTKGECARHIFKAVAKTGAVAVYIGDSLTDEDAFRVFANSGITVRVGISRASQAEFYFRSRTDVDTFLKRLAR